MLGSTIEFGTTVLRAEAPAAARRAPGLHVDFRFTNDLQAPLLRDEIDLAVDCRPHVHPAVHRTELFREKYVVVAAPEFLEPPPGAHAARPGRGSPVLSLDREGQLVDEPAERPAGRAAARRSGASSSSTTCAA